MALFCSMFDATLKSTPRPSILSRFKKKDAFILITKTYQCLSCVSASTVPNVNRYQTVHQHGQCWIYKSTSPSHGTMIMTKWHTLFQILHEKRISIFIKCLSVLQLNPSDADVMEDKRHIHQENENICTYHCSLAAPLKVSMANSNFE